MSETADAWSAAARWLEGAGEELDVARLILGAGRSPSIACFHAHLAAEKALKAMIVAARQRPPYVHDLPELRTRLPERLKSRFNADALALLNPWAIQGRYTDQQSDATPDEAERLIQFAGEVVDSARAAAADLAGEA